MIFLQSNYLFLPLPCLGGEIPRPKKRSALYPLAWNLVHFERKDEDKRFASCMFERSHTASTLYARAYSVGDSCYSFPCRFTRAHAKMSKDIIPTFFRAPILTPDWGIAGEKSTEWPLPLLSLMYGYCRTFWLRMSKRAHTLCAYV